MSAFIARFWKVITFGGVIVLGAVGFFSSSDDTTDRITAPVVRGDVTHVVSVSGFTQAKNTAELGFPGSGVITGIFVDEGSEVAAGELLATLGSASLITEREQARAALARAEATRDELLTGPTSESRAVTAATVAQAEAALKQTLLTELTKVQNAEQTLRTNDLRAYATNANEDATAPSVTGSYTCETEGAYTVFVYNSSSHSGYSYRYHGLETGTESVHTDQPHPLGECGLSLQFTDGDVYTNSTWDIPVPNTRSTTYLAVKTAYDLAVSQAEQNIAAARTALALAKDQAVANNAAPRVEALVRANATIQEAQASVAKIDAALSDRSVIAPFAGTVTSVTPVVGEVARTEPVITLIAEDAFEVRARVPEIDITKVLPGQIVHIVFDAKQDETVTGVVDFVSPLPDEIDGVAYFLTYITLNEAPPWLKAGLNADVEIITAKATDVLKLPERFIQTTGTTNYVYVVSESGRATTTVELGLVGNDGFVEVRNLDTDTVVVAP